MKGQVVVGAIALVLVFIVIAGSLYFFVRSTRETVTEAGEREVEETRKETEAAMAISEVYSTEEIIEIKNIGSVELPTDKFALYLNTTKKNIQIDTDCGDTISPGEKCNITLP